jgi:hypothetical protein
MVWRAVTGAGSHSSQLSLAASKGETHSANFAAVAVRERQPIMQTVNVEARDLLLIAVPLQSKIDNSVIGVLEVVQRNTISTEDREGLLRFVRSMAAVTVGCRAFSQASID